MVQSYTGDYSDVDVFGEVGIVESSKVQVIDIDSEDMKVIEYGHLMAYLDMEDEAFFKIFNRICNMSQVHTFDYSIKHEIHSHYIQTLKYKNQPHFENIDIDYDADLYEDLGKILHYIGSFQRYANREVSEVSISYPNERIIAQARKMISRYTGFSITYGFNHLPPICFDDKSIRRYNSLDSYGDHLYGGGLSIKSEFQMIYYEFNTDFISDSGDEVVNNKHDSELIKYNLLPYDIIRENTNKRHYYAVVFNPILNKVFVWHIKNNLKVCGLLPDDKIAHLEVVK